MPVTPVAGITAMANRKLIFVITLVTAGLVPKMTEISAGSSLDISDYLYADGWAPQLSTNKVTSPRRVGSGRVFEKNGLATESLGDLHYMYQPQAAAASAGKKAFEVLTSGATGYIIERLGLDAYSVDFAIGQFVNVIPVQLGVQLPSGDSTDEAAEFGIMQSVSVTSPGRVNNVAVIA
jgi:hypothetical protein